MNIGLLRVVVSVVRVVVLVGANIHVCERSVAGPWWWGDVVLVRWSASSASWESYIRAD